MAELSRDLPAGRRLVDPLRHHAVHPDFGRGSDRHPGRGDGAGVRRHVPVPAELARDPDPVRRRPDRARRRVPRPVAGGLLDQRADPVRHGAGDRHPGRRRDRRDRECRAHHARREAAALRSDGEGDGADHPADHRHHFGADRGVHPDGLLPRDDGRNLSPILAHAGDLDRLLGAARADADPGAVRHPSSSRTTTRIAAARSGSASTASSPASTPGSPQRTRSYEGAVAKILSRAAALARRVRAARRADAGAVHAPARLLPAAGGPGLSDHRHPGAAGRDDASAPGSPPTRSSIISPSRSRPPTSCWCAASASSARARTTPSPSPRSSRGTSARASRIAPTRSPARRWARSGRSRRRSSSR